MNQADAIYLLLTCISYTNLEKSGTLQAILTDPEFGATRPFLEDEIKATIAILEASTAATKERAKILRACCETSKGQLCSEESLGQARTREKALLRRKHVAGRQHTTIVVL